MWLTETASGLLTTRLREENLEHTSLIVVNVVISCLSYGHSVSIKMQEVVSIELIVH